MLVIVGAGVPEEVLERFNRLLFLSCLLLLIGALILHVGEACSEHIKLLRLQLIDVLVRPAEHLAHNLIDHVAQHEGILVAQLVDQIGEETGDLYLAKLLEELGGQVC